MLKLEKPDNSNTKRVVIVQFLVRHTTNSCKYQFCEKKVDDLSCMKWKVEIRRRESMTFKSISAIKRFGSHETSPSDIWGNLQSKFSGFYLRSRIFIPLPFEASLRFNLAAMIWAFSLPTFCVIASARKWRVNASCTKLTCIFIISPGADKLAFPTFINESLTVQRVEVKRTLYLHNLSAKRL